MAALAAGAVAVAGRAEQAFSSGKQAVPLVELFTSEGCSSCPPAERWLAELRHEQGLWRDFVPVAWHVNYWDRLGWPDKFAAKAYTDRQYAYATEWKARTVYTPGFVRAGQEWRLREGDMRATEGMIGGVLGATIEDGSIVVSYQPPDGASLPENLVVHAALLGGGIASDVRAGENRGKQLEHEFLVLAWQQTDLKKGPTTLKLPSSDLANEAARRAIALWISAAEHPTPLQAVGGWLDD